MGTAMASAGKRPNLKHIAIPAEHGGWALVGAPIVLGLLVAPSLPGLYVALSGLAIFMTRHPLRLAVSDLKRSKFYPRTNYALMFASAFAGLAGLLLVVTTLAAGPALLAPLAVLVALGSVQFAHDLVGKGRTLLAEASGATAMAALATAIALAGGASNRTAWILALILALHGLSAIVYVAKRLRLSRGERVSIAPVALVFCICLTISAALALSSFIGWLVPIAFVILASRAAQGLTPRALNVSPAWVGVQEIFFTLMLVLLTAVSV